MQRRFHVSNLGSSKSGLNRKSLMAISAAAAAVSGWASIANADTFGNAWATDGNQTALNSASAWINETGANPAPPGSSDIASFDINTGLTAATTFTLGTNTQWQGIIMANPGSPVVIGGTGDNTNTLTIGSSFINMSAAAQNLTIADPLAFSGAQTLNVGTGATFTQGSTASLGGNLTVSGAGTAVFSGVVSGSNQIVMNGTGVLTLSAQNTYTNGLTANAGTINFASDAGSLAAGSAGGTGTLTLNGGLVHFSGSTSGSNGVYNPIVVQSPSSISGSVQIAAPITGSSQLNASLTSGQTLAFIAGASLTGYSGLLELGTSVGTLRFNGVAGSSTFGVDMGTGTANINTRNAGTFTIGSLAGGPTTLVQGSSSSTSADTFSIGGLGASTTFAGSIQNGTDGANATTGITLTGGTLDLTGANTYTGATTISAGTLQVGANGTTGSLGNTAITNNSALVFSRSDGALSVPGAISGSGVVTNAGSGIVTLTGNNSYSGGTNVNSGILQADNATSGMGTGAVQVNNGGGIGGVGNITAPVTIASGGQIAPGDAGVNHGSGTGVGTLSVASLTLNSGSIVNDDFTIGGNDLINVTGANGLTVNGGGIDLYQAGSTNAFITNGTYNVFQLTAPYGGSVTNLLNVLNAQGGVSYLWGTSGNDITLTISGGSTATTWVAVSGGTWTQPTSWSGGVPNSAGSAVTFGPAITAPATITLDGSKTVGNVVFNNSVGGANPSYTIAQGSGGNLIFDSGSSTSSINVVAGSQAITSPVTLNSNLAVAVSNSTDTLSISGAIGGVGGLSEAGSGVIVLSGANNYAAPTSITSGTLQIGAGGSSGSLGTDTGSISIGSAGTLVYDLSTSVTLPNIVAGSGKLVQSGSGTLVLAGVNTYSGGTTINAGTVQIATGNASALGTAKVAFGSGGVLDLNGNSYTLNGISGTAGTIDNVSAGGTPTLTFAPTAAATFSGNIANTSGVLTVSMTSGQILSLGGNNTYSGGTSITAGSVKALSNNAYGTGTILDTVNMGVLLGNGVNVPNAILVSDGSNSLVDVPDASASATLSGPISLSSAVSGQQYRVGATGAGSTLTLTGPNTGTGSDLAIITRGNVVYAGSGSLTAGSTVIIGRSSATSTCMLTIQDNASVTGNGVDIGGNDSTSDDLTTMVEITGNGSLSAGTGAFNFNDSDNTNTAGTTSLDLSGNASISAGSFSMLASSVLLTQVTISGGTINATASDVSPSAVWFPALTATGSNLNVFIGSNGATINNNGFSDTIAQPLFDNGGGFLVFKGSGTTTLTGGNSYTGNTTVQAGTLVIGASGALPNNSNVANSGSFVVAANSTAGNVSGAGSTTVNGGVTFNANNFTQSAGLVNNGNVQINGSGTVGPISGTGTLSIGNGSADTIHLATGSGGSAQGSLVLASNATLDIANNHLIINYGANSDPIATIRGYLNTGRAGGAWTGPGIDSSAAAGNASYTVGYADGADGVVPGLTSGQIEVAYVLFGDLNLDGVVNGTDFGLFAANFGKSVTKWDQGDLNYDGVVNGSDFGLLAANFGKSAVGAAVNLPASDWAALESFAAANNLLSDVPEPASLGLLALAGAGAMARRRRRGS